MDVRPWKWVEPEREDRRHAERGEKRQLAPPLHRRPDDARHGQQNEDDVAQRLVNDAGHRAEPASVLGAGAGEKCVGDVLLHERAGATERQHDQQRKRERREPDQSRNEHQARVALAPGVV